MNDLEVKFYQMIGARVKYFRQAFNLGKPNSEKITQEKLAELADVSTSTIGNLESEKVVQGVSPYTLWKISKALNVSVDDLLN